MSYCSWALNICLLTIGNWVNYEVVCQWLHCRCEMMVARLSFSEGGSSCLFPRRRRNVCFECTLYFIISVRLILITCVVFSFCSLFMEACSNKPLLILLLASHLNLRRQCFIITSKSLKNRITNLLCVLSLLIFYITVINSFVTWK